MAFIRERNNSYQICVSCGYDTEGKQIIRTKTWKPTHNMTKRQIEKELNRQTVLFEEACWLYRIKSKARRFYKTLERGIRDTELETDNP